MTAIELIEECAISTFYKCVPDCVNKTPIALENWDISKSFRMVFSNHLILFGSNQNIYTLFTPKMINLAECGVFNL